MIEKAVHIVVRGKVQGVYFRASTESLAQDLGLGGWVWNCGNGTVEIHAEGKEDRLKRFVEWCRKGPPAASVSSIDVDWVDIQGMRGFRSR
ncbi:MAG: acylphosphatase [Nitrospinota bacterium]|nr:acylphosphatase [Nitrospinota bacterium]